MLVARGEHSAPDHRDGTQALTERLNARPAGSVCEVVVVPDVGHGVHLDRPAALADLVRRVAVMAGDEADQPAVRGG